MKSNNPNQRNYGFWNWGTGITITIIAGALATLFLVYKTTTINFDLAEEDYYAQELKYNGRLEAMRNAQQLSSTITISQNNQLLIISVPTECINADSGIIRLYRPSSQKNDLVLNFAPDSNGEIHVLKEKLISGVYRLKADWHKEGKEFYYEQRFYVEK